MAVIVFSTYLDYFPSKLVDIRPRSGHFCSHCAMPVWKLCPSSGCRESESQGMPLACLLLPMVCCAAVHSALYNATHLLGNGAYLFYIYIIQYNVYTSLIPKSCTGRKHGNEAACAFRLCPFLAVCTALVNKLGGLLAPRLWVNDTHKLTKIPSCLISNTHALIQAYSLSTWPCCVSSTSAPWWPP